MPADEPLPQPSHPSGPQADVPVFNCHVYLSPPDAQGQIVARAAQLAEVIGSGGSEREALRQVVQKFKEVVGGYLSRGEPIPWLSQPAAPAVGDTQRFVPVHF